MAWSGHSFVDIDEGWPGTVVHGAFTISSPQSGQALAFGAPAAISVTANSPAAQAALEGGGTIFYQLRPGASPVYSDINTVFYTGSPMPVAVRSVFSDPDLVLVALVGDGNGGFTRYASNVLSFWVTGIAAGWRDYYLEVIQLFAESGQQGRGAEAMSFMSGNAAEAAGLPGYVAGDWSAASAAVALAAIALDASSAGAAAVIPVIPRSSNVSGAVPLPLQLVVSELAFNAADGVLYGKLADGTVVVLSGVGGAVNAASIGDASAIGRALLTAVDATAARTALDVASTADTAAFVALANAQAALARAAAKRAMGVAAIL